MSTKLQGRPLEISIGHKYGMLTVLERSQPSNFIKHNRPYWLCQCECGNTKIVSGQFLKRSRSPSCGCSAHLVTKNRRYNDPKEVTINSVFTSYRRNARRRNLRWHLSREQFMILLLESCHYCGSAPSNTKNVYAKRHSERHRASKEWSDAAAIALNGIDRLDNNVGYTPNNCVSCCEICNKAKRNLTYNEFTQWIRKLVDHFGR